MPGRPRGARRDGVAVGISPSDRNLQSRHRRDTRWRRVAGGARVSGPRTDRGLGISGVQSQAPAPHPRDPGRAGRTDRRRAIRPGLWRNDAVFRMVDDQERARRSRGRAGRRRSPVPPGRRVDAGLAPSGSPRCNRARRPVADAGRAGVFRGVREPGLRRDRDAVQPGRCGRVRSEPPVDLPAWYRVELLERDDQHPVGHRPPQCRQRGLSLVAPPRPVCAAGHEQCADGARRIGHVRRVVVHARNGSRLGPFRAVVSAGWCLGRTASSSGGVGVIQHDAHAAIARRNLRRALVAGAQARARRWHSRGRPPAARRLLRRRTRGAGPHGHPVPPPGRRPAWIVDLHRRVEPRGVSLGAARGGVIRRPSG